VHVISYTINFGKVSIGHTGQCLLVALTHATTVDICGSAMDRSSPEPHEPQ